MSAADWYRQGVHHAERFRFEEASVALQRAIDEGAGADGLATLSAVRGELGDIDGAQGALARAVTLRPDDPSIALLDATLLPMVYRDAADLERWRARYTDRLEAFARDIDRYRPNAARILGLARTNFLLAYQGRDDTELQRLYGKALSTLLREACPRYFEPRRGHGGSRLRVGFASAYFFDCTVGRYFASWIEGLDRERFEVVSFMTGAAGDAFTERLAASCLAMERVNLPVLEIAGRIAAAQLDVLVYPEVGMDPRCRLLAGMRLAPVQLAAWGHPQTTGSPEIDGYLSCESMEPPGAAAHYTEKLMLLPGIGVSYDAPEITPSFTRKALKIDAERRVYCCPHSVFKIHPDSDAMFADLLERDPDGLLIFFQAQNAGQGPGQGVADRLVEAMRQRGLPPRGQVRLFPRLSPTDFRRALQAMDVVLDPPHWSGGNTALDALGAALPVVTVPGALMRSRQAAAMLRELDAAECIAEDTRSAAALAEALARDTERREALRARMAANRSGLFRDPRPVRRLEEILGALATTP